jgi:hypothetical protein
MTSSVAERKQATIWSPALNAARALGFGLKRGAIRGTAIVTMLVIYVAGSLGSLAPTALGVAGVSGLALTATASPADAQRRRRRRRRRRWYRGLYFRGAGWGYRHRRRRRRRRGGGIYLRF